MPSASFQTIKNLYDAHARSDLDAFYADLSPTISWTESAGFPTPGTFSSAKEITENVFAVLQQKFTGWEFNLERIIDGTEGYVVAIGVYKGTSKATGKGFEARASHLWNVVDGKIVRFEQFADTALMREAMRE